MTAGDVFQQLVTSTCELVEGQEEMAELKRDLEELRIMVRARTEKRNEVRTARDYFRMATMTLEEERDEAWTERDGSWYEFERRKE